MTKSDLTFLLAEKADITVVKALVVVDTIFESMRTAMVEGRRIEIRGFGTFSIRDYEAYEGRNPRNGKTILVPKKRMPFFKPGKPLADALRGIKHTSRFGSHFENYEIGE